MACAQHDFHGWIGFPDAGRRPRSAAVPGLDADEGDRKGLLLNRGFLGQGDGFFGAATASDLEAPRPREGTRSRIHGFGRVRRSAAQLAERRDVVADISLEEDPPIRVTNPRVLMGYENADDYPGPSARRLAVRGAPGPGGLGGEGFPRTD